MRIYIFKSEANDSLCAFAGDAEGSKLPAQFAPWHSEGVIEASRAPPHEFSRIQNRGRDQSEWLSTLAYETARRG